MGKHLLNAHPYIDNIDRFWWNVGRNADNMGSCIPELVALAVFGAYFRINRSTTSATPSSLLEATITSASWRSSGVTLSTQTPSPAY